jgi:glycosyltransferase involved in cell wall biosynthesis
MKRKILCILDYYYPGSNSGGPAKSIKNLSLALSPHCLFYIFTRDSDAGSKTPYSTVPLSRWVRFGSALVFYSPASCRRALTLFRLLFASRFDILYLNSYFSVLSIFSLVLYKVLIFARFINAKTVILAPRGELTPNSVKLKPRKKALFIYLARLIRLHSNIVWQASSGIEKEDILRFNFVGAHVLVAPDLVTISSLSSQKFPVLNTSLSDEVLRIIFVSRLVPKKNLLFLLRVLSRAKHPIHLGILGPMQDPEYWSKCSSIINSLPNFISVELHGPVPSDVVSSVLRTYDVFFFPTLSENFGHVIFESLSVGTCVVVSDNTPWISDPSGALKVLSLDSEVYWLDSLGWWASLKLEQRLNMRNNAMLVASSYLDSSDDLLQNEALFLHH